MASNTEDVAKTLALGMVVAGADEDVAIQLAEMHVAELQAEAWDRLCRWLDDHDDSDVRERVKWAARQTNPWRRTPGPLSR